jgi:hypothetical protein
MRPDRPAATATKNAQPARGEIPEVVAARVAAGATGRTLIAGHGSPADRSVAARLAVAAGPSVVADHSAAVAARSAAVRAAKATARKSTV